jgi:hypothetical protein
MRRLVGSSRCVSEPLVRSRSNLSHLLGLFSGCGNQQTEKLADLLPTTVGALPVTWILGFHAAMIGTSLMANRPWPCTLPAQCPERWALLGLHKSLTVPRVVQVVHKFLPDVASRRCGQHGRSAIGKHCDGSEHGASNVPECRVLVGVNTPLMALCAAYIPRAPSRSVWHDVEAGTACGRRRLPLTNSNVCISITPGTPH